MIEARRSPSRGEGRRSPAIAACAPLLVSLAILACAGGGRNDEPSPVSKGINGGFTAAASAACPRADLLSLQPGLALGSVVNVDVTVTDCDASLPLNGLSFELIFDDTAMDFVGCSAGSLFPAGQLAQGTPDCTLSGGDVLGTIALQLPNSVRVSLPAGQKDILRLTFNVTRKGIASPVSFQGIDSLQSTSLFFADPSQQTVTVHLLGGAGYAGGSFTSN